MELGMIGLGRMGANMVRRLQAAGHRCVAYDVSADAVTAMEGEGVQGARSLDELVAALAPPRNIWVMVPAAFVADTVARLALLLSPDDTIIDGGNSWYRDDVDRAGPLAEQGLHYLDVGTSGGVFGLERGYCLMVGGDAAAVERLLDPIDLLLSPTLPVLAPPADARQVRLRGRDHGFTGLLIRNTRLFNHTGNPALALPLPAAVPADRRQASLQLAAACDRDAWLLDVSEAIETLLAAG
jgi:6-phosphogluconate dehydrogenase